jgi:dihydrofolate synthase / folylpolyglutamate synthase
MLTALTRKVCVLVLTRPEGERAADPAKVAREHGPLDCEGRGARVVEDPVEALKVAVRDLEEMQGVVLVTGSLYAGAPVLRWLREE